MPERVCEVMRIHIINPNTTFSMTEKIAAAAEAVAGEGTEIFATQPEMGPVSIEGYYDEAFAVPGMLARIAQAEKRSISGHIIACFDDTGLDAARSIADAPVVGIGEASFHAASLIAGKFSVITTLSRSIPAIEHNLARYGLATRCTRVRASEIPVLSLDDPASEASLRISEEIERAKAEDGCDAIVLGCAGMADLAARLSTLHQLPVVDGVAAAVGLIEMLNRCGLKTSKRLGYATPQAKTYAGDFARFAPRDV
jgi:allantoin racemase